MDPLTLLTAGPSIIRAIGSLFGGKTKEVTEKVAGVVDSVSGLSSKVAQRKVKQVLDDLPPDALVALKVIEKDLAQIAADREKNVLQAETDRHSESQETIRAEAEHGTVYVKETRPKIARQAFIAGTAYALIAEAARLIGDLADVEMVGADMAIASVLYGPTVFYMTMRSVDGFSRKGKS